LQVRAGFLLIKAQIMKLFKNKIETQKEQLDIPVVIGSLIKKYQQIRNKNQE
jgi:hypothetical protein